MAKAKTKNQSQKTNGSYTSRLNKELMPFVRAYKKNPTIEQRNELANRCNELVKVSAWRVYASLYGSNVEYKDLVQEGFFGFVNALDRFDLSRKSNFVKYARKRIEGRMKDYVRIEDPAPRTMREREKKLDKARTRLEIELGRSPTDEELRHILKVTEKEFEVIVRDSIRLPSVTSLDISVERNGNNSSSTYGEIEDFFLKAVKQTPQPSEEVARREVRDLILKELPKDDRLIILLFYYESLKQRETGEVMGYSESRVSQKHASILERLRAIQGLRENLEDIAA